MPPTRSAEVQLEAFRGHLLPDVHRPTDVETTTPATPPELSPDMLEVLDLVQWGVIQLTDAERQRFKELGVYVPPTVQWLPRRLAAADGAVPSLMYRSDDSDPHEVAYNEIAPGLERRVSRDHPDQSGLRYHDPELDFLTGFERQPDGRLSDEALVVYLRQQQSNLRRALVNLRYRAGVTLTGFDDDDAITADSFTPEQLSDHPELAMFLQRRALEGGLHSDGNPDSPWEVEVQEYAGVRVRFYSMAGDDTAAGRRELVARALLLLQESGVDLPGRRNVINVYLPRYHRAVSVQAGDAGSNPNPTVRVQRTAGAITTGAREAEFFAPGDLVLTSGLVAPRPHGNPLWNQVRLANRMDDDALGVVAGALMQLAHWSSSPYEYADLSFTRLRIAASRIGNRLSERAGKNGMQYAAEFGLNNMLGERHQPDERRTRGRFDRRAGDTEELKELNSDVGGPVPGRPVTAPTLSDQMLEDVVSVVRRNVVLGWVTAEQVRHAEQTLSPPGVRWLSLPHRVGLIIDRLSQHFDRVFDGVRHHPGMGNVLFEDVAAEWAELWKTGATSADLRSGVDEQVAQIVAAMGARTTPLIERHWRHDGPAAGELQSDRQSDLPDSLTPVERRAELERLLQSHSASWSLREQHHDADLRTRTRQSNWADRWTSGAADAAHDLDVLVRAIRPAPALSSQELDSVVEQVRQQVGLAWVTAEQVRHAEQSLQSQLRWLDLSTRAGLAGVRLGQHLDLLVAGVRHHPGMGNVLFEDVAAEWAELWKTGATSADLRSGVDEQVAQIVAAMGARTTPLIERHWRHDGPAAGELQSDRQSDPPDSLTPVERRTELERLLQSHSASWSLREQHHDADPETGAEQSNWADRWNRGDAGAAEDLDVLVRAIRPASALSSDELDVVVEQVRQQVGLGWVTAEQVRHAEQSLQSQLRWLDLSTRAGLAGIRLGQHLDLLVAGVRHHPQFRYVAFEDVAAEWGELWKTGATSADLRSGVDEQVAQIVAAMGARTTPLIERGWRHDGSATTEPIQSDRPPNKLDSSTPAERSEAIGGRDRSPTPEQMSLGELAEKWADRWNSGVSSAAHELDVLIRAGRPLAGTPAALQLIGPEPDEHHDEPSSGEPVRGVVDLKWIDSQWDAVRGDPQFRQRLETVFGWLSPGGSELTADGYRLDEYRHEPAAQAALRVLYMWHRSGEAAARRFAERQRVVGLRGGSDSFWAADDSDSETGSGQSDSDSESSSEIEGARVWQWITRTHALPRPPDQLWTSPAEQQWAEIGADNARVRLWLEAILEERRAEWNEVSEREPVELKDVLDAREWWRLYLNSDDHAAALRADSADPGAAYEAVPGGFSRAGIEWAFESVLNDRDVLEQQIDWAEYRRMRALVIGSDSNVLLGGVESSEGQPEHNPTQHAGAPGLAHDIEYELIGDQWLVVPIDGTEDPDEVATDTLVIAGRYGDRVILEPFYSSEELPEYVDAVFEQYYAAIDAARTSDFERLKSQYRRAGTHLTGAAPYSR